MESAAFKKLTEQLTEIVQYVRLARMAFQDNLTGKGLKPMLTNDDAAKMLGVSKRTLRECAQRTALILLKLAINADTKLKPLKEWLRNEQ